jgi:hypothetical protein
VNRADTATYGGTVILSGTTNSTGGTSIYAGTLEFSDFNQLGSDYLAFERDTGDSGTVRYTSAEGLDNFTGDYLTESKFVAITAVPEPAALAMAALALALALRLRRFAPHQPCSLPASRGPLPA